MKLLLFIGLGLLSEFHFKPKTLMCRAFIAIDTSRISLTFDHISRKFKMNKSETVGEHSTEITTISKGKYAIKNGLLYIYGDKNKKYKYKIIDSVTIKSEVTNNQAIARSKLMCSCMCREDDSVVWKGFWKNGLKNGLWFFYDEYGSHIRTAVYENGIESKAYIHPSLLPPNMRLAPYKF